MKLPTPRTIAELDDLIATPDQAVVDAVAGISGDFAVLGAGGKMGFHFCLMLRKALGQLQRSNRVWAVSRFRSVRSSDVFYAVGCDVLRADLDDSDSLNQLPDVENVFYLAGVKFGTSQAPDLLNRYNIIMPQRVASRFRSSRIVAMSTGCVYSFVTPESGGSSESDPLDPPGEYARSCLGRERAFFDASARYGTATALIRLNYAIDLRYGVLVDIASRVLAGEPVDLTTGHVNVIWQGDAIRHTICCLDHVACPPFVLNITGPEILSVRDLANAFGKRFGRDATFTGQEAPDAWLNNATKAHQLFGNPSVGLEQMLDWVADWLQNGGQQFGKPTQFQIRDGKY